MILEQIENGAVREAFASAMGMRASAAALEKEAEQLKKDANALLEPLFELVGEDKVENEGVGTVSRVLTTRETLDKDLAKENLAAAGVDTGVISVAFSKATKVTESVSVRFTPVKVK
jgi:hypothetical protein